MSVMVNLEVEVATLAIAHQLQDQLLSIVESMETASTHYDYLAMSSSITIGHPDD